MDETSCLDKRGFSHFSLFLQSLHLLLILCEPLTRWPGGWIFLMLFLKSQLPSAPMPASFQVCTRHYRSLSILTYHVLWFRLIKIAFAVAVVVLRLSLTM